MWLTAEALTFSHERDTKLLSVAILQLPESHSSHANCLKPSVI